MTHIYSSKILLNTSITLISKFQVKTLMMFLKLLVKILLPVMDLNITNKLCETSKNIQNSDFRKITILSPPNPILVPF